MPFVAKFNHHWYKREDWFYPSEVAFTMREPYFSVIVGFIG